MPMSEPTHVVAVAEGEGRAGEQQRAADHPAERLDEHGVEQERGGEQADGPPVEPGGRARRPRPPPALPTPPRETSTAYRARRPRAAAAPRTNGTRLRADRVVAARRVPDAGGVGQQEDQPRPRPGPRTGRTVRGPGPARRDSVAGGVGRSCRTCSSPGRGSCRISATAASCSLRKVPNSSPVTKASVQPRFSARPSSRCEACIFVSASIQPGLVGVGDAGRRHDAAPVGEDEVDAGLLEGRHVRQRVDALLARHREDLDLAGLDLVEELAEAAGAEGDLVRR